MLFNSLNFLLFLPIVFILYWSIKPLYWKNCLLLFASYFFYACWDWRFLFLLMFSTGLDYFTGLQIVKSNHRRFWFWLSIIINVGSLGVFKYYNFFAQSFTELVSGFGLTVHPSTINVILPVGISFYTFHGLSYVIDVYKGRIKAENNIVDYCLFVSFFPLLVAGPIERATHLLPQIKKERPFDYKEAVNGLRQILWGLFKKIVIADQCARYANFIFNDSASFSGSTLIMGAIFFAIQIYGDFSGYSDIALGTARLFGFELLNNFRFPYFSRDIAEFWRRWHISLSSWFRDYLYIPLGGSKQGELKAVRNTFIIFLVSGFWHGANWTFIAWGFLHACAFLPLLLMNRNRRNVDTVASSGLLPTGREFLQIFTTFSFVAFAWIFFRAKDLHHAFNYIGGILSRSVLSMPQVAPKGLIILIGIFFLIEWVGRRNHYAIEKLGLGWPAPIRVAFYYLVAVTIFYFTGAEQQFIYFQF